MKDLIQAERDAISHISSLMKGDGIIVIAKNGSDIEVVENHYTPFNKDIIKTKRHFFKRPEIEHLL